MSKLAQQDELLIKRKEHTVKKHVPAPKEPKKSQANDIEYWCRMFMSYIISGRLKYLPRIASTIGHLEPTSSSHQRAKRKEQVNGFSSSNLIFVQNLFNPATVFDVFKMVGSLRGEFNFDTIFAALEYQDYSKIVEKEHLPGVYKGSFIPFLLMLLYVKLIKSTPEESLRLYSILFKLKQRKIDLPFFKTKLKFDNFINGLVERRIRFYNNYFDDENNIYVHKASLHYNELFETGTLEFINMQKKAEAILKNELYSNSDETANPNDVDNQKPAFEKKRDYFLQEDCFTRIREYFGKSEKIVLFNLRFLSERLQELDSAIFSDKNLALINSIMAAYLDKQITLQEIPEHCLRLLTKFCLIDHFKRPIVEPAVSFSTPNLPPLMDDDKLPDVNRILDSIELVKRMMTGIKTSDRIFPLCVVFLGAAVGVLPTLDAKGAYDIIITYLRDQPKEFVTSPYLSSLLNGVGHLMTNITEGQLLETAQLLLNLWTYIEDPIKNPPKIEVPQPPQKPERKPVNVPRVPANQQKSQIKRSATSNSSETAVLQEISSMNAQMGQGSEKAQAVDYNRMAQTLNKNKPLPVNPYDNLFNFTVALQLNKIFRHVYRTRMARYESLPLRKRKYRKYLYKKKKEKKDAENKIDNEKNTVVMNNNANEKVLPPENPNLEMALQHPVVDIEDETDWLIQLMNVCQHSFGKTENPVAKFMCLFAAAGVMKGMLSREESEPAQVINSFDDLVTSGIFELNAYKMKSLEVWRHWRQGLAVLCVLIEKKFPNISDETIIQIILDVLLEDVLDFEQILTGSGSTSELVQHVDRRSGSPMFKLSNYFTHAVAELFLQIENPYLCNQIVLRLASFARHIHELWRRYLGNGLAQNKSNTPLGLNGAGKIMKPIFTTIFLSYIVCLKIIEERLNIEQTYLAIDFLGYIEFCSFKGLNLQRELLSDLVVFVSNQDPVNFLPRLISYIPLINDKDKFTKDSIAPKDKMTISKFSHFLNIFDILLEQETFVNRYFIENTPVEVTQDELHQDEDDIKQKLAAQHPNQANINEEDSGSYNPNGPTGEQQPLNLSLINRPGALNQPNHLRHTILPLLFIFIEHSNKNINRKSHGVFRRIFANPNLSLREEIAPYYLKLSLHHYPELTSVESLAENTTTVVTKFPPTSPLIAHWLKSIAEKIKSIQLTKSATYITIILFQMVTIVNLYFLNFLLRLIEEIIHSSPKKFQLLLCKLLFKIISNNFDYTRKETCIKWYLHLVHDLGLRHEKL